MRGEDQWGQYSPEGHITPQRIGLVIIRHGCGEQAHTLLWEFSLS